MIYSLSVWGTKRPQLKFWEKKNTEREEEGNKHHNHISNREKLLKDERSKKKTFSFLPLSRSFREKTQTVINSSSTSSNNTISTWIILMKERIEWKTTKAGERVQYVCMSYVWVCVHVWRLEFRLSAVVAAGSAASRLGGCLGWPPHCWGSETSGEKMIGVSRSS